MMIRLSPHLTLIPSSRDNVTTWRQLTVITISDHHTRVSTGGGAQEAGGRVIGLLFGSQNGLDVSIFDAMEVACTAVGADGLELNEALVEKQKDLCELQPARPPARPPPAPACLPHPDSQFHPLRVLIAL